MHGLARSILDRYVVSPVAFLIVLWLREKRCQRGTWSHRISGRDRISGMDRINGRERISGSRGRISSVAESGSVARAFGGEKRTLRCRKRQ